MLSAAAGLGNTAVSETNGKFGAMHGSMDSQDATSVEGSITWPFRDCFGFQLDGLYSNVDQRTFGFARPHDEDFGGVGGHFFWRDSGTAMLGLEAGYVFSDLVDSYEIGFEAERYFEWFTLGAKAGFASIDFSRPILNPNDDTDGFFGQVYIGAYPMDNLLITAIVESRFDNTSVGIEVEYQLPVRGLSIFASAAKGESDYDQAFVGMRYYFGEDKPLIRRHRESDPRSALPGIVTGIGSYKKHLEEQAIKRSRLFTPPFGPGGSSGGSIDIGGSGSIGGSGTIGGSGGGVVVIGPGNSPGGLTYDGSGGSTGGGFTTGDWGSVGGGTLTHGPGFPDSGNPAFDFFSSRSFALTTWQDGSLWLMNSDFRAVVPVLGIP